MYDRSFLRQSFCFLDWEDSGALRSMTTKRKGSSPDLTETELELRPAPVILKGPGSWCWAQLPEWQFPPPQVVAGLVCTNQELQPAHRWTPQWTLDIAAEAILENANLYIEEVGFMHPSGMLSSPGICQSIRSCPSLSQYCICSAVTQSAFILDASSKSCIGTWTA